MEEKTNNKNKIVLSIFIAFFLVGVGVFFYLKNQIKPDELKASIIEKLEESIPGANVSLGELTVRYGSSFTVEIKGMDILLRESLVSKRDFLQVSDIKVKLPLLSLLTGGGNLEVYLKKPELFLFRPEGKKGNWDIAFNAKPDQEKAIRKNSAFKGSHNIILPAFLINSTAALRMTNLKVYYDISNKEGVWSASKLILKNVGLNSNAAFEVESNFKRVVGEKEKFSFDTVLIGSIELEKYLKTGTLNINSNYKVKNLKTREHPNPFPLIRGNSAINLDKNGALKGSFSVLYQESELNATFDADSSLNRLNIEKSKIRLNDVSLFLPSWAHTIDLSQSVASLEGSVLNKLEEPFKASLKFNLTNARVANQSFPYSFNVSGSLIDKELKSNFKGTVWQGNLDGSLEGNIDLGSDKGIEERITFYTSSFNFKGNTLPLNFFRPAKDAGAREQSNYLLPKGILNINYEDITFDKKQWNGGFSLKTELGSFEVSNGVGLVGDGKIDFSSKGTIFKEEVSWKHELTFKNLETQVLSSFFSKDYPFLNGRVDGKLKGVATGGPLNSKELTWQLRSKKGQFKGFDNNLFFDALVDNTMSSSLNLMTKKKPRLVKDDSYENLEVKFTIKEDEHHIEKMSYLDSHGHVIALSGFVDPKKENRRRLVVQIKGDKTFQKKLKKRTKLKKFPLSFYTEGYQLSADPLYSLNQLAKKFRFKKDRNRMKKVILKVKTEAKRKSNEKS